MSGKPAARQGDMQPQRITLAGARRCGETG